MVRSMKRLQQDTYHNDHKDWLPIQIQTLAAYQHIGDGFYVWECGSCWYEHSSRTCGWPIAGQVESCEQCKSINLLVSTLTDEINELRSRKWAEESVMKELEELRGIQKYNADQLIALKRELWDAVESAMRKVRDTSQWSRTT